MVARQQPPDSPRFREIKRVPFSPVVVRLMNEYVNFLTQCIMLTNPLVILSSPALPRSVVGLCRLDIL